MLTLKKKALDRLGNTISHRRLITWALVVALILLIPLVLTLLNPNARVYGGEGGDWDWAPGGFVVMGLLLFCTGLAIDFAVRKITHPIFRMFAVAAIVLTLLAIWVELAVDGVSQMITALVG